MVSRGWVPFALLAAVACSGEPDGDTIKDRPGIDDTDTDTDTGEDTGDPTLTSDLLATLGNTVWHGEATRDGVVRRVQQEFRADQGLWAELVNPWGPARHREMRELTLEADGTVSTNVTVPSGWPDDPEEGRDDIWTIEVVDGDPRQLVVERDGVSETYTEGPEPSPTTGLTAAALVFQPGGNVDIAFCDSGLFGFDYPALFDFARGAGEAPRETDVVAGATLAEWADGNGDEDFAVADVPGFELLGGTTLTDKYNYLVTYRGTIDHPGGFLAFRERNDSVADGLWVFLDSEAGSGGDGDFFLAVHGFAWPDGTDDEPFVDLPAGSYDLEVIVARCTEAFDEPTELQVSVANGPWQSATNLPATPWLDLGLFPPPF